MFQTPDIQAEKLQEASDMLKSLSLDELLKQVVDSMVKFAINLAIAIIVFYIGKFIISRIHNVIALILLRRKADKSLTTFLLSLVRIVLYFVLIIICVGILGIETSSFLALFASAGVAIGMALSGTLQNFAGGVLILLLKPYKIGDYIEAQGYAGTVREIQIFHTIICTYDNKSIILPNGGLSTASINNWSREDYRRVSWKISISYGDNVEDMRKAVLEMFAKDDRIVEHFIEDDRVLHNEPPEGLDAEVSIEELTSEKKPSFLKRLFHHNKKVQEAIDEWNEKKKAKISAMLPKVERGPSVIVNELADSAIIVVVRAWVRTENYWSVFYEYNERFYNELPSAGINFPFPQMDVHVKNEAN